jgi:hypothetical protein
MTVLSTEIIEKDNRVTINISIEVDEDENTTHITIGDNKYVADWDGNMKRFFSDLLKVWSE